MTPLTDAVGAAHSLGISGKIDLGGNASLASRALESLGRRAKVARPVVDDGDTHFSFVPDS